MVCEVGGMSLSAPFLVVRDLAMTFSGESGELEALGGVSFDLARQDFVCVLGPSGSGKSTLLRILAGLLQPTGGTFEFNTNGAGAHSPRIGLVFQQINLMPWRNVLQNIALPLELQGVPAQEAAARAREMIATVGMQGFENTLPRDLSGGMAQRVAIARALLHDPDLLLLDEPFGALDALTRERMGAELLDLWQAQRKTVLMVTHSISEALLLSDRVLVLTNRPGRICLEQIIDLPRPRHADIRYDRRFTALEKKLRAAIECAS
jgi:NitT/TauT family transport system ATP-binding protein